MSPTLVCIACDLRADVPWSLVSSTEGNDLLIHQQIRQSLRALLLALITPPLAPWLLPRSFVTETHSRSSLVFRCLAERFERRYIERLACLYSWSARHEAFWLKFIKLPSSLVLSGVCVPACGDGWLHSERADLSSLQARPSPSSLDDPGGLWKQCCWTWFL